MVFTQFGSDSPEEYVRLFSLEGKTAVVTGAVGHLGSAISKGLAAHGAQVVLVGRTEETLRNFVTQYGERFANRFSYEACDVTNGDDFGKVVRRAIDRRGAIDVLVNNAFSEKRRPIKSVTHADWDEGLRTILTHQFLCTQAVLPSMLERGTGSVINTASIYGSLGIDQRAYTEVPSSTIMYSAAKGAVLQMTRRFATEFGAQGIRFNTISPGFFPKPPKQGDLGKPNYVAGLAERTPMQRIGYPDELAGAAVFLASDASSYVTGQNIVVDGGFSAW